MDYSRIRNAAFESIDHRDSPDYTDAFCVYAEIGGQPLTDSELDELNDSDFKHDLLMQTLN
jgi:hypothetical protein